MDRILKFSYVALGDKQTGRELLANLNAKILREIAGDSLIEVQASKPSSKDLLYFAYSLLGWLDGLSKKLADESTVLIKKHDVKILYIEGSNYGRLAKVVKGRHPSCLIITFFHNVESRFFWGSFKSRPSVKAFGVLIANYFAERMAVKYSDRIVCLNRRDSHLLKKIYGFHATDINPLCIDDGAMSDSHSKVFPEIPAIGLFVGGAFYANLNGVRWFVKNVAEKIDCRFYVVGRGFKQYKRELEFYRNVKVIGEVDDVGEWYARSSFVFSPVFDGSGMKTKTAEAIQHGRPIFGTTESFVGYEDHIEEIGKLCNTSSEFIEVISNFLFENTLYESSELRHIYLKNYSYGAAKNRMKEIIEKI